MDKALFKDLYVFELDRREKLAQGMSGLIGALTVVGGVIGFGLQNYSFHLSQPVDALIAVFAMAGACAYAASVYSALQFYHLPEQYRAIATSAELWAYYEQLKAHFANSVQSKAKAAGAFEEYLSQRYSEATDVNAKNNNLRGNAQSRAFIFLTYAVAMGSTAFLVYYVSEML
jgi:hypothetical protein